MGPHKKQPNIDIRNESGWTIITVCPLWWMYVATNVHLCATEPQMVLYSTILCKSGMSIRNNIECEYEPPTGE